MCDLIRRQDAIDALEKVAELYPWRVPGDRDSYSKYNEAWNDALDRAESEIEALPSAQPDLSEYSDKLWQAAYERGKADALDEIVRCKDCKHWSRESICDGFCSEDCMRHDEDFYCGYAERRTDESD